MPRPACEGLGAIVPEFKNLRSPEHEVLLEGVRRGQFRAIARLITLIENGATDSADFLRELFPLTGRCFTIGVTGAPGVGKSTLVDGLAGHYRQLGLKVGIIAVDPTSPFTGGAILGDRIRMRSRSLDPGTFIRSMATRGHLGGLSRATGEVLDVLDAAGFDIVLVETVGVGQDEVEVARAAHATLVLLVPGMGDDVQALKAGIMEIGDVFVINKADREGAARTEAELRALLSMSRRSDGWRPGMVRTVASEGAGLQECARAIEEYRSFLESSPQRSDRAQQVQRDRLLEMARARITEDLLGGAVCAGLVEALAAKVAARETDPYSAVEELIARYRLGAVGG